MIQPVQNHTQGASAAYASQASSNFVRLQDICELYIRMSQLLQQSHLLNRQQAKLFHERQFELRTAASSKQWWNAGSTALLGVAAPAIAYGYGYGEAGPAMGQVSRTCDHGFESYRGQDSAEAEKIAAEAGLCTDASRRAQESAERAYSELQKALELQQAAVRAILRN